MNGDILLCVRVYNRKQNASRGYREFLIEHVENYYDEDRDIIDLSNEELEDILIGDETFSSVDYKIDPIQISD